MKKTNHQIKYILHKDISITVKIKKYKYSRNYKVTYDKKNLQALVSIPNLIAMFVLRKEMKLLSDEFITK